MSKRIYRLQYRGSLLREFEESQIEQVLYHCTLRLQREIQEERLLTASLYHYKKMLFFYYEAVDLEYRPEELLQELTPYLELWPGQDQLRSWVQMYQIFYHAIPKSVEDWKRTVPPERKRGRIAFLKPEYLFSYVYHHIAIVEEGLLQGDQYHSIALHENILFSYFEEPKTMTNIRGDLTKESEAIKPWLAINPEEHFIQMPEAEGANFMFLQDYFTL